MTGRITDYRGRIWLPLGPDAAAGYDLDALGDRRLMGLVVYGPTTDKLRGTKIRDLEKLDPAAARQIGLRQEDPPGPETLADRWARLEALTAPALAYVQRINAAMRPALEELQRVTDAMREELEAATAPGELVRRDGEDPDDFYRRIARAHAALAAATPRPTTELAKRAGTRKGTAGMWVSRARARGLYPTTLEGEQ